jgi:hypothetical protein
MKNATEIRLVAEGKKTGAENSFPFCFHCMRF